MPVIPATWEAKAGELLEPGKLKLQWAEIAPLHSSLGNKSETPPQKKKKEKKKDISNSWINKQGKNKYFITSSISNFSFSHASLGAG